MSEEIFVVVGGGYSGLSFAEEIRKLEKDDFKKRIIIYSAEEFCSRPNIFFRLKFPTQDKVDFGEKAKEFYEKNKFELRHQKVVKIDTKEKYLLTENGEKQIFDKLLLSTGSVPNYINKDQKFLLPTLENYQELKLEKDIFVIRDIQQVTTLNERILSFKDTTCNIFVVGSGALSLDICSSITEGFKNENVNITILSRRKNLGFPLLDFDAAEIITKRVQEKYSKNIKIIFEDSIESIEHQKDNKKINLKSKKVIEANIIVQAVGVHPNSELGKNSGLKIGKRGGTLVNEKFECSSVDEDIPKGTIFSYCGDCTEITDKFYETANYLNWTMCREESVECAKCIMDESYEPKILFSQTLKLFNLFISCSGHYKLDENENIIVKKRIGENDEFVKLTFEKIENDKFILIGALIFGEKVNHFRLGTNVLSVMKSKKIIDEQTMNSMIKDDYKWTSGKKYVNPVKSKLKKK
eukprot:gene9927-2248_t